MLEFLTELFQSNDVFSGVAMGGIIASIFATFLYSLKSFPNYAYNFLKRHLTVSLIIHNRENLYDNFNKWLYQFENCNLRTYQLKSGNYSSFLKNIGILKSHYDPENAGGDNFILTPGVGHHFLWYQNRPILIKKNITKENTDGVIEEIEIITLGRSKKYIVKILDEIENIISYKDNMRLYINDQYNDWALNATTKFPLNSIIWENKEKIINDINTFFNRKDWYFDKGLRHKLGILLSGPPGTGKSKLVSIIASILDLPIYMLNLNSLEKDNDLLSLIRDIPPKSILLIEDIDCFCVSLDRENDNKKDSKISLSTILNALDGINSPDGIVYILSTNYPEKLDKALIREGRIDLFYTLTDFNKDEMREMYNLYINDENFEDFYKELGCERINPAKLQNILLERIKI